MPHPLRFTAIYYISLDGLFRQPVAQMFIPACPISSGQNFREKPRAMRLNPDVLPISLCLPNRSLKVAWP